MDKIVAIDECGCVTRTDNDQAWTDFIKSVTRNNTYVPAIRRIIFNLKTTEMRPVLDEDGKPVTDADGRIKRIQTAIEPQLATVVYFSDGTKCSVVNSGTDAVKTEVKQVTYTEYDESGTENVIKTDKKVIVASEASKEAGLVYAIVKRLLGKVDTDPKSKTYNQVKGDGFGRKLKELVSVENTFDTQYEAAYNDVMKDVAAAEHKEREALAKERRAKRAPTVEENIATLVKQNAEILAKLAK